MRILLVTRIESNKNTELDAGGGAAQFAGNGRFPLTSLPVIGGADQEFQFK